MSRRRWILAVVAIIPSLFLPNAFSVSAASSTGATLSLSPNSGLPATSVQITGSIGHTYKYTLGSVLWDGSLKVGSFTATGGTGTFATRFTVPSSPAGSHAVSVVVGGVTLASTVFSVLGTSSSTMPTATPLPVATSTPAPSPTSAPAPSSSGIYVGVWQPGQMTGLSQFEQETGKHAAIVMDWRCWAGTKGSPDLAFYQAIHQHGSIPLITWNSTNWDNGQTFALTDIANGVYDNVIASWAQQLAGLGFQVMLRFDHEMNGTWYTGWSGNPTAYVAAWKHVHDVFVANGATNVLWVWSPNVWWPGSRATDATPYYPGDAYVDWMGLDGYNYAPNGWMWFTSIFNYPYNALTALAQKPLLVAETSTAEATTTEAQQGQTKPAWIANAYGSAIPSFPRIKAVVWFNEDKVASEGCCNWPIESTSASQSAFAQAIVSSSYRGYWP